MNRIVNSGNVTEIIDQIKNKITVFTNGCFDLLHPGHVDYLTKSKALGDILIVGLNSDKSVRMLKGRNRPINNQDFRSKMLLALKPVDMIVIFDEKTPIEIIKRIKPKIHVKGGDYIAEQLPEYETVKSNGGSIKIIPFVEGYSSTSVIDQIRSIT